ncbi:MAG: KpsF/GutQ family sugar-phosphate isomerase [Gammaproteobacteria bacterium]|nr:KpsF/GutQ family sugar-phosphate isomerase [Gammaproteobacteria bacterium]MDH4315152.1 KpsF/GutQ family sugar-phosphate isomerase [Gammaproteobacteria bacterium]MDH5213605.1 KpsF/GutQ family sugar-phosphate isomerase [Gammaproteobacteria bacterium]MDH5501591.1 KpsF/GutQ family sugar-phosphate isomerase [Gammaproteobacteria bacterium]
MAKDLTPEQLVTLAGRVLDIEARAVERLRSRLDDSFARACELCLKVEGRVVVTGMGKSGHVGGKIAATLASTGTPAFFMHPAEASHGDLGMITRQDLLLAVSYSGETQEIITILPLVKRMGAGLLSMTGRKDSTLARAADVHLDVSVSEEACPLNLAPTASTTATLAMGDALAVALLETRGFTAEDFALSHPSGSLGKKLLLRVEDVMHTGAEVPEVRENVTLSDGLLEMTRKGLGMTGVVDTNGVLVGVFTDGDLRRALDSGIDIHKSTMKSVMHRGGIVTAPDTMAAAAVLTMEENKITALLVVDKDNKLIGALNVHDLFRAGIM